MVRARRLAIWINLVGGSAVLASYAHGVLTHPAARGAVWGGVPDSLRPLYTVSMLTAAAGYFAFSGFVIFGLDPERTRVADRYGFGVFNALYALILLPSALWMPLTFAMLEDPSQPLWWSIRLVLAAVGIGSLGFLAALLGLGSQGSPLARRLAVAGCAAFCFQTAVLDALVWTAYYPTP